MQGTSQQNILYPDKTWLQYVSPEDAGYSSHQLEDAYDCFKQIDSASLLVINNGAILLAWGDVTRRFICHSVRKSYMNALYGIYVNNGTINLNRTLAELNIDDVSPLSETEKDARIIDLLASRSGVYHPAAAEHISLTEKKPDRGSHKPGTHWYYNNWDFNALLTIFEQETGRRFFEEFKHKLADPLQMEEFRLTDTFYYFERDKSIHPAYHFRMSAKDMARFGLLYLRKGRWKEQQIIPETWITRSITDYSDVDEERGYGYLWWTIGPRHSNSHLYELETYMAIGGAATMIVILPGANLVVVHQTNTYQSGNFDGSQFWTLLDMILKAKGSSPISNPKLKLFQDPPKQVETIKLETGILDKYIGDYEFEGGFKDCIRKLDDKLVLTTIPAITPPTYLLPLSETRFILEDTEYILTFALDNSNYQLAVEYNPEKIFYAKLAQS